MKIATASWSNGKLKFEFCAPVDAVTGKPALDTEATAAEVNTEGATRTVLSASVSVPVFFDSQLAQDDESEICWELQQGAPCDRSVKLSIPSKAMLAFMAGLVNTLGSEGAVAAASNSGRCCRTGRFRNLPFLRAWGQSGIYHGVGRRQFRHASFRQPAHE